MQNQQLLTGISPLRNPMVQQPSKPEKALGAEVRLGCSSLVSPAHTSLGEKKRDFGLNKISAFRPMLLQKVTHSFQTEMQLLLYKAILDSHL